MQELDETAYWLELIGEGNILPVKRLESLHTESEELMAILVTIVKKLSSKDYAGFASLFILHPFAFIL